MANEKDRGLIGWPGGRQRKSYRKARLPVMPLAVLLPPIGELTDLRRLAEVLERRLEGVQEQRALHDDDTEQRARLSAEESMLNQVLQWLLIGEGEE